MMTVKQFNEQELDDYQLRMGIASLLERIPDDVLLVLYFYDDRMMRMWVAEAKCRGCRFLNMVDTPDNRVIGGVLDFLLLNSRMTLKILDKWLKKGPELKVINRRMDSFLIVDMLLAGNEIKQVAQRLGIPEKTVYNRLRGLTASLDLSDLNRVYWLKIMRLCADYDAIYPASSKPESRFIYQAQSVTA